MTSNLLDDSIVRRYINEKIKYPLKKIISLRRFKKVIKYLKKDDPKLTRRKC